MQARRSVVLARKQSLQKPSMLVPAGVFTQSVRGVIRSGLFRKILKRRKLVLISRLAFSAELVVHV